MFAKGKQKFQFSKDFGARNINPEMGHICELSSLGCFCNEESEQYVVLHSKA